MKWNWQRKEWPNFNYNSFKLEDLEKEFLIKSGVFKGVFKHISENDKKRLIVEFISDEAINTSEIEGEFLNRDSVQSSIMKHFGLKSKKSKISDSERGVSEMMIHLFENYNIKLTNKILYDWHSMLCLGRNDLKIGKYRTHKDPMKVVSGPLHKPKVHFEAPPSDKMSQEMNEFISWFNNSCKMPILTRASIAHLYFVCIHPFEDGNGRIGRALVEKSISESLGYPALIALSTLIQENKKKYYEMLEKNNKDLEISEWIIYFSNLMIDALDETSRYAEFLIEKTKCFDRFKGEFNSRQEKAINKLFEAGPNGFEGGLSASNYRNITRATSATATRDLSDLVDKGALRREGELKHTRYFLNTS